MAGKSGRQEGMFSRAVALVHAIVASAIVYCAVFGMWTARTEYAGLPSLDVLTAAPEFELPSLTEVGSVGGLRQHRGRPTVVAFWSVWNADSVGSFILLEKLKREAPDPVDVVAVNVDRPEHAADAVSLLRQLGSSAEVLWDRRGVAIDAYHVRRLPAWFLVGSDGTLLARGFLPTLNAEELKSAIAGKRG